MRVLFILALMAVWTWRAVAQDAGEAAVQGTLHIHQRFVDTSGREQKYREFFNLQPGPSTSLELTGNAGRGIVDRYAADIFGVGSDRYSGGQVRVGKTGLWDLRVNYRESAFFWNRNDQAEHPTGLNGLTTNHDWDTERRFGSVHLNTRVTPQMRLTFDYDRNTRTGVQFTTRALDYFGAGGTFAAFQRSNPYAVGTMTSEPGNVDEGFHRLTGGLSYSVRQWNVFYKAGFQRFTHRFTLRNLQSPQRSINIDEPATASELLTAAQWEEFRRLNAPVSEFSYTGQPHPRLRLRGAYIYYRYSGPASLDAAFSGTARVNTAGTAVAPYNITSSDRASANEPNHIIDQGFTIQATNRVNVYTDYRYTRFEIASDGTFEGVHNGAVSSGSTRQEWRTGLHQLDVGLEILPSRAVIVRPGIRLMKRDVTVEQDGLGDDGATARSNIVAPVLSIAYRPSERLNLRGDFQSTTNGGPYTRISPRTNRTFRFTGRFAVNDKLTVENNTYLRNGRYTTTEFENSFRSSGVTLTYTPADRLGLFGGFVYDSFFATAAVNFLRGTAPLDVTWRDQTISRVWQAGIDAGPFRGLELRMSGNYLRTTGTGEISGELPISGPLTWPMVTGTVTYNFGGAGRFALDAQRTYYVEELMVGDNFGANVLSIRWSKDF